MGVFRKGLSISTLGLIDFRSDKERIARWTRRGAKAQRETNRLLARQNRLIVRAQHATSPSRPRHLWDLPHRVPARELWAMVTGALADGVRQNDVEVPTSAPGGLVAQLSALAELHTSGELTDGQYEAAKDRLLA